MDGRPILPVSVPCPSRAEFGFDILDTGDTALSGAKRFGAEVSHRVCPLVALGRSPIARVTSHPGDDTALRGADALNKPIVALNQEVDRTIRHQGLAPDHLLDR
jgi:hypothetical protein